MPNNGIISRQAVIPDEFKVATTTEFNNETDVVILNKALTGSKVEQKAVTLNQLAGMIGGGEAGPQGPMGPAGPAGPAVPSGLDWRGAYNNSTAYELNDVVTWVNPDTDILGSYWVTATGGVTGVSPTNGSGVINTGWAFLASQGPQGPVGPAGPQGIVGPQGPAGTATLPYRYYIGRITFGAGTTNIFQGHSGLGGTISASRLDQGMYKYTFSISGGPTSDFNGLIIKYILNIAFNANTGRIYVANYYNYDSSSIGVNIYEVNVDTGEYLLADPDVQGTFYYIKYD